MHVLEGGICLSCVAIIHTCVQRVPELTVDQPLAPPPCAPPLLQDREMSTNQVYSNAAFTQTTPKPPPPVPGPSRHEVSSLQAHAVELTEQNA